MRRVLPVVLALLAVVVWQAPAQAAGHTVTLATSGPSPSALTIKAGDTVTFKASDANTYHLRRTSGAWTFTATVTSAKPFTTPPFTASGTYGYAMTFDTLIGESPPQDGSIVVPSSTPSPSPTATRTASPSPRPSASATARPSGSASPSAVPTQSGVAIPPPIQGGVVPTPTVTPSVGPQPQVAPPGQSPSATPVPSGSPVDYGSKSELAGKSTHGLGLPAALAVVGVVGVVSLLVRLLLAAPEARPGARPDVG